MKIAYKLFIIFSLLIFVGCDQKHQNKVHKNKVELSSFVDEISSKLSDKLEFTIQLNYDKSLGELKIPEVGPKIQGLRILEPQESFSETSSRVYLEKTYVLQSDFAGTFVLPEVELKYKDEDKDQTISTGRIFVEVLADGEKSEDSLEDIEDIDDLHLIKYQRDYRGFYGLLILSLLIGLIYFAYKRFNNETWEEQELSPQEWALEALDLFQKKDHLNKQQYKEYYTDLSYIYRGYIGKRFKVNALESTKEEMLVSIASIEDLDAYKDRLKLFFQEDEIAKYAEIFPSMEVMKNSLSFLSELIDQTTSVEDESEWEEFDE
ncbi:MAG: hypothetical protein KC646_14670 [Candidatus Cloacimonetes bacterium]|nr:hypothetical protein [Candidatus Cloacimonadota bacterium]